VGTPLSHPKSSLLFFNSSPDLLVLATKNLEYPQKSRPHSNVRGTGYLKELTIAIDTGGEIPGYFDFVKET
jgi:hypothetical protein